ncbi:GumC family protein [Rhodovibrionaceae bacterium A322]
MSSRPGMGADIPPVRQGEGAAPMPNASGSALPGGGGGGSQLDIRQLFGVLRRRKYLIVGLTLFITALAALYSSQLVPLYSATSEVIIQRNGINTLSTGTEVVSGVPQDWLAFQTEAKVIASRDLARQAVIELRLGESPLFNPLLAPYKPSLTDRLLRSAQTLLSGFGLVSPPEPLQKNTTVETRDPATDPAFLEQLTDAFAGGLSVQPSDKSRLISISYVSTDANMAALAPNTIADIYLRSLKNKRDEGTGDAVEFLQRQVDEASSDLIQSQRELANYRREKGIQNVDGVSLRVQQLSNLETRLLAATSVRQEVEARYNQARRLLDDRNSAAAVSDVLGSDLVQNLMLQEIELERRIAELATQYRDKHPRMINARAELTNLQTRIGSEIRKVVATLQSELEVTRVRERNLKTELDRLRATLQDVNVAQAEERALEAEIEIKRRHYETLLQRLSQVEIQDEIEDEVDAKIINRARPPWGPFYPKTNSIIGMAFAASLLVGVGISFLLEFMESGFRSLSQIESETGLPTLGMLPFIKMDRGEAPHFYATDKQGSLYAESVRTLRTGLMLCNPEVPPKLVVITSSVPDEGKTSTVLSVGAQSTQAGRRSIVIDCDLRHPSVDKALGYAPHLGLGDYLAGEAGIEDIISMDERSGMHFIGAGTGRARPVELLSSPRMYKLIQTLNQAYQLVLLDTPPVLAVSDALPLLREADALIYLVRWEKTKRDTAKAGIRLALESGARLAGIAMTNVDVRRHAQYDYADSRYYYNKSYRKYYAP